ncbi:MAG: hypothetical protein WDO73_03490 [Ignavibacteriota bacterium]
MAQYSAEYGRASGGQINVVTQAGSNQWHGGAWDFLRNNVLDSRPFKPDDAIERSGISRNQFGALIGGAILKNRLFAVLRLRGASQPASRRQPDDGRGAIGGRTHRQFRRGVARHRNL